MKMIKKLTITFYCATAMIGLSLCLARASGAASSASGDKVLATVGSMKITEAEVDVKARPQMAAIQNQIYTVKKRVLDNMIDDYLVEQAAKKAGLSKEAYLKREVTDKASAPTEKEMQDFYDKNKDRIHQPYDKIKVPLERYMERQKVRAARDELMASLRKDANVKVMLKAPRIDVNTAYAAGAQGPANAPVTLIEFSDYQCPFCGRAESTVEEVLKKYGKKIRFVYMDFPLPMHPYALHAAEAARCAGDQGKYWEFHDAMFADQSKLDEAGLKATAAHLKLDTKKFDECMAHSLHLDEIKKSQEEGQEVGVDGTPTFVINGRLLSGAVPAAEMESVIDDELAAKNVKEASAH